MKKVTKAVIPVAGLGTRFLPYTKAVPKEMLPIVDLPAIHFIIEEALAAGIEEIIFITSRGKQSIENYFEKDSILENFLRQENKHDSLKELGRIPVEFRKKFVIQEQPKGLGHAILQAKKHIGTEEYFAVFLPDDLIFSKKPAIAQLIAAADKVNRPVIAVEKVPRERVSSYGIIKPRKVAARTYEILDLVEKPDYKDAFSNLGIVGRYVLPASVFAAIERTKPGAKGEIQLTDALHAMIGDGGMYAYEFEGMRCDTGTKFEYLIATLKYAAMQKNIRGRLKKEIKKIFK